MKLPLVLLHGWAMNSAVCVPLLPLLEKRFRVTLLELPGHGEAPWRGEETLDDWAHQALAAAPSRAAWVGWSLGGLVARQAAMQAPERVDAFIGIATTPCFTQWPGWPWAMAPEILRQFAQALAQSPEETIRRFLALQFHGVQGARTLQRCLQEALARRPAARPEALRVGLALLLESDLRESAPSCGSSWILGERDRLVPPALADALAPDQVRLVPGAGHAPFLSHPEAVADAVTGFLT